MAENGKTSFSEQLDRMRHSMKKSPFAASQEYRAVMNALQDVVNYQGRSVGETSKEMVEAHSRLGQACETYLRTREGARTSRGKSRLDMVGAIYGLQQQERDGVNAMRTPSVLKDNSGKKWNEVLAEQRVREFDTGNMKLDTVGAGSSFRTVVPIDGDIAFFTKESKLVNTAQVFGEMAEKTGTPRIKEIWEKASGFDWSKGSPQSDGVLLDVDLMLSAAEHSMSEENYKEAFEQKMENYSNSFNAVKWNSFNADEKRELIEGIQVASKNNTLIEVMAKSGKVDTGSKIPERNVATSRLADLLGQNHIIAKSEKARLINNGRVEEGIVMARAEGLDINERKNLNQFISIQDFAAPEFQRQITNLEIMDLIAGQVDRNVSNMFYQMAELEDGKTRLTGVQGIDNDAAFGLCGVDPCKCKLSDVKLVDAGLHENLMKIDRATLDYTFGDILNEKEISALENRLDTVKEHLAHATILQPDEWNMQTSQELSDHGYMQQLKEKCTKLELSAGPEKDGNLEPQKEEKAPEATKKEISLDEMVNAEKKAAGPEAKPARENSVSGLSKKEPAKTEPRFVIGSYRANKGREK